MAKAERVGALRETLAMFVAQQIAMVMGWLRETQRAQKQDLTCRRPQQVGASNDFCDLHSCVVDYHSELVGGNDRHGAR